MNRPALTALLSLLVLAGCNTPTREWTPADHDTPPGAEQAPPPGKRPAAPDNSAQVLELADMTWVRQCQSCHGPDGRGDGPQGRDLRAADLTKPTWQKAMGDEQIAAVIRSGRGRMPAFDLPPQLVKGLVLRIRSKASP